MSPGETPPPRRAGPARAGLLRRTFRLLAILGALGVGLGALSFWALDRYFDAHTPAILSLEDYAASAAQVTRVYDAQGAIVAEIFRQRRTLVGVRPDDPIPPRVLHAAVAAEDGGFYEHGGLDFMGIARALLVDLRDGRFSQGASTITMQVARTFYLSRRKTLTRKLREVFLARKLERHLTKDELLTLYLNQVYFGRGRYGIREAARYYLGRDVAQLSLGEAALLVCALPAPERLNPFVNLPAALRRRRRVLRDMVRLGFASAREARAAAAEVPKLASPEEQVKPAPWFTDAVLRRLRGVLGRDALETRGYRVWTTLRPAVQRAAQRALNEHLEHVGRANGGGDAPQGAVVVMDPATRQVWALVGGRDHARAPFHRAVQARRQVGSTFKTFVYGAGIEAGLFTPSTAYRNQRRTYRGAGGAWAPANAEGGADGRPVTIADALARSLNVVAVAALQDVGVPAAADFARRAGLRGRLPADLSLALGSGEASPLDLANAYATIATRGLAGDQVLIRRVEAPGGAVVYAEQPHPQRVIAATVCDALDGMLRGVVERGTGRAARLPGVAVAGKTGTTQRNVDAWFVGYTPDLLGAVWVGRDHPAPIRGGSGGRLAAPIWRDVMAAAERWRWHGSQAARGPGAPRAGPDG